LVFDPADRLRSVEVVAAMTDAAPHARNAISLNNLLNTGFP